MNTLWRYLRGYRTLGLFLLILAAVAQILSLVDPLIFGRVIDNYALHPAGRAESSSSAALYSGCLLLPQLPSVPAWPKHFRNT